MTDIPMPMHEPRIVTDGGPWAVHDMPCPVCQRAGAVLNINNGIFEPCGGCTVEGWVLIKINPRPLRNWIRSLVQP